MTGRTVGFFDRRLFSGGLLAVRQLEAEEIEELLALLKEKVPSNLEPTPEEGELFDGPEG